MAEQHLSLEASKLFQAYETHHLRKTDNIIADIERITDEIKKLQIFLSEIGKHTDESMRVDWSSDPTKIQLVDDVRAICPQLIDHGVYSWKGGKEVENLIERTNNHINRTLSPQISQKSAMLTQAQYENNEVLEVMTNAHKDFKTLIDRIQSNLQRAHG